MLNDGRCASPANDERTGLLVGRVCVDTSRRGLVATLCNRAGRARVLETLAIAEGIVIEA